MSYVDIMLIASRNPADLGAAFSLVSNVVMIARAQWRKSLTRRTAAAVAQIDHSGVAADYEMARRHG
jgi:hypothetical protein